MNEMRNIPSYGQPLDWEPDFENLGFRQIYWLRLASSAASGVNILFI